MALRSALTRAAVIGLLAAPLMLVSGPAQAAQQTLSARTFPTTWAWTGVNFPSPTATADQHVVGTVSGITSDNRNAGLVMRSNGTTYLRAQVKLTKVTLEDNSGVLGTANRPGSSTATSGTLDASVAGSTVTVKWNGTTALTYSLTKSYTGKTCGMQVWQDAANAVTVGATCDDVSGGGGTADWLSGTATVENGNGADPAKYFSDWRGTPVEIGQTWPNTPDAWGINPAVANSWAGFQGPMSLSYSPGPDWQDPSTGQTLTGWRNWATVAGGGNDAWWTAAARQVKALRTGRGTTYISPFYEYNGDWMAWSVTRTTQGYADFKAGWARVAGIFRREFPAARLVLPAACSRDVPAAMLPDPSTYDLGGCTIYNNWPWESNGATTLQRLEVGRQRAAAAGKPFGITEWANAANPNDGGGGGDAPDFISAMHSWMVAHAGTGSGQLVFETFFNIPGYSADHELVHWNGSAVQVSTTQPQTAARYRDLY